MDIRPNAIVERFPEFSEQIVLKAEENEDFKCLCADYGQCIQMIESLRKETGQRQSNLEECLEIKVELEQEVLKILLK